MFKKIKMLKLEYALVWLNVKTWGKFGEHVIKEKNFGANDLETVIMILALPRNREKSEQFQALTDSIMEKFEQDCIVFSEWAAKIHEETIGSILETLGPDGIGNQEMTPQNQQPVKILEWDSGK